MEESNKYTREELVTGSYGALNRGEKPISRDISQQRGWGDLPRNGGEDPDLVDYFLDN